MAYLDIKQLRKAYNETEILKGIDLEINDQEFVVFVGPSGCGKTTLLRSIAGLEEVTSGQIVLDSTDITQLPPAKRDLAMVFQSYALYPHMSVKENMSFALKLAGIEKAVIEKKVKETAEILELGPLLERKPKDLSGGQRQRVAIGRAIVRNPKVFLFDEPLSNLDAALRIQMRLELAKLHKELKTTMIYVTHDQVEAMTLADKVVLLNQGKIEQIGSPLDLYTKPANKFVAGFLGMPRMSFLDGKIVSSGTEGIQVQLAAGENVSLPTRETSLSTGTPVSLGVRPEHVSISDVANGHLQARLEVSEHLGSDTYYYVKTPTNESITIRSDNQNKVNDNEAVGLQLDLTQCHLFEKEGNRIY
ncbi:Maltose/maltodextrin import ATP-binding protein MalK [Thalassocella blandensis]|nr:Maltose/maltodextrin import ATP-binding protein MalK [Thalassocella blandensis]